MDNKLRFDLKLLPHPYSGDFGADFEAWGALSISVTVNGKRVLLLRTQWNLDILAEWFAENQHVLCQQKLSLEGNEPLPGESLAQAESRLRDRNFADDEEEAADRWYDALSEYVESHSLRWALPGANIPGIVVGCNYGAGEISFRGNANKEKYPQQPDFYADLGEWTYKFDMEDFLTNLRQDLQQFLSEWLATTQNSVARVRIKGILEQLIEVSQGCCR